MQDALQQQQILAGLPALAAAGAFSPQQAPTANPLPTAGPTTPTAPSYQPGQIPSYPLTPPTPLTPLPQVPDYAAALAPATPPSGGLQLGQFGGMGSGLTAPQAQAQAPDYLASPLGGMSTGLQPQPTTPGMAGLGAGSQSPPAGPSLRSTFGGGLTTDPLTSNLFALSSAPGGQPGQSIQLTPPVFNPATGADDPRQPQLSGLGGSATAPAAATVPGTADIGGTAQVPGTADTAGTGQTQGGAPTPAEQQALAGFRQRESGGKYDSPGPFADDEWHTGAYQFGDREWKEASQATGIGTGFAQAKDARPWMQDANALWLYRRRGAAPWAASAGRSGAVAAAHADMGSNLTPEEHGIGTRGAQILLARMPQIPQQIRMMDPRQVAQLIDKNYPGASDAVKGAVFLKILPLMNEQAKEQTADAWTTWKAQMEQWEDVEKAREADIKAGQDRFGTLENFIDTNTGQPVLARSYQAGGGRVGLVDAGGRPLDPNRYRRPMPGEVGPEGGKPQNYQIATDPETNQQYWSRPPRYPGDPTANVDQQGKPYSPSGFERVTGPTGRQWSSESIDATVEQAIQSGDPGTAMARLPRSGPARQQFEDALAKRLVSMPGGLEGGTAKMVMNKIRWVEARSAAQTTGRITVQTDLYANEAELAAKQVIDASRAVPRTELKPINDLILAWETNTGSPQVVALGQALNNLRNVYGKMSNPTGTGIHDADKAAFEQILGRGLSQGQLEAGIQQLLIEGHNAAAAALKTQQDFLGTMLPVTPPGTPAASPGAAAQPSGGGGTPGAGGGATAPPSAATPGTPAPDPAEPPVGTIKIGKDGTPYSYKGGGQYDVNNWEPVAPSQAPIR